MGRFSGLVVTCEHGGNGVPAGYEKLFQGYRSLLGSHRGWDAGALILAREIAREMDCELISATVTRLLVDLNRSLTNPRAFSEASRGLDAAKRAEVVGKFYHPHRDGVESALNTLLSRGGTVLHLSVHSFTPILNGRRRNADIGLLYDPARRREAALCLAWQRLLEVEFPDFIIRRNYPYRGKDDGLTTALRKSMSPARYLGVELEFNQKWVKGRTAHWRRLRTGIVRTLQAMLA
jgi:predicted N-formylglutamate amidohydrolase